MLLKRGKGTSQKWESLVRLMAQATVLHLKVYRWILTQNFVYSFLLELFLYHLIY